MFGSSFTVLLLAGFAVSALALACGVCRDMGVRPLAALRRFAVKLSLPGVIAFGLVAAPLFKAGSTKRQAGDGESEYAGNGELRTDNGGVPRSGGGTNEPPSFAFTMIDKDTNRVELAAAWAPEYVFSAIGLYYRSGLVSNDCSRIDFRTDVAGATSCSWTIADSAIVTNKCAFFGARGFLADDDSDADGVVAQREVALGLDPDSPDSDGDGLLDGEELGCASILSGDDFLWMDISSGAENVTHYKNITGAWNYMWILDEYPVSMQGASCNMFDVYSDGFMIVSRDGESVQPDCGDWIEGWDLRHNARSGGATVVAAVNHPMESSCPRCIGVVETNGASYVVYKVEGQHAVMPGNGTPPAVTYEVIVPFDETNAVYVSYLEVDDAFAALGMDLGVQCPSMLSAACTNELYTIPAPPGALRTRTTVKYVIGRNTDPRLIDTDGDGVPDGFSSISDFDADGDGLVDSLDPEPIVYGGDFHGQSDAWVQATFTNANEILSVGYANWVDAQVGVGLTNGLYKLTVSVTNAPANPVLLSVGDYRVVVTNVGDCVFLLEKGIDYEYGTSPFFADVVYSVVDDAAQAGVPLRSGDSGSVAGTWSTDGGYGNTPQTAQAPGLIWWMPMFVGSPDISHIWPNDGLVSFAANLTDVGPRVAATYLWTASDGLAIQSPNAQTTQISIESMPSWAQASVSVSATIGGHTLTSHLDGLTYGTNATPQVHLSLDIPNAILLNSNEVDSAKIVPVGWVFSSDAPTSGTVRVTCLSGDGKFRSPGFLGTRMVSDAFSIAGTIEGIETSDSVGDVVFRMQFTSGGQTNAVEKAMTVVRVGDVLIPSAPADGLVVLTNTSVAMSLACEPQGSEVFLSTMWHTRRLKSDGSFDPWQLAAYSHPGAGLTFTPLLGGIYQTRAVASVAAGGSDERFYRWDADENPLTGLKKRGDMKPFGVCDEQWQIDLRNCAKGYLGSTDYALETQLVGMYDYTSVDDGAWKCNYFVAYRIRETGLTLPVQRQRYWRKYPPLANDWAGRSTITGWSHLSSSVFVQPGYVVGHPGIGNGHCGIVDFDGEAIAAGAKEVNRKYKAWLDGTSSFNVVNGGSQ